MRALSKALRDPGAAWAKFRQMAGRETWNIGIVDKPAHAFLSDPRPGPVRWLPELVEDGYLADPFPYEEDGRLMLLAEGYDYGQRTGYLVAIDPDAAGGPKLERIDLPLKGHLSYPLLVAHDGVLCLIPESSAARQVALLRGDPFPIRWTIAQVLLDGFAGCDATPLQHDGRWWMFCGNQDDRGTERLYLFMAEALTGPWRPHPGNPVKSDAATARPGGLPFVHDGALYRPAQDCSRTYGGALVLNRVTRLTETEFAEEIAVRVEPDRSGPYPDGLHHFVPFGDVTIIDGKRERFDAGTVARWARWKLASGR